MRKGFVFLVLSFLFTGCGVAQKNQNQLAKQESAGTVTLICTTGPVLPPLYVLRYKEEDYILDTANLKYINPENVKRIKALKAKAGINKYENKGKNGAVIIETN